MGAPQPGQFGDVNFSAEVIGNRFKVKYDYSITPKTSGYPSIQQQSDPLMDITLRLRLNIEYNQSPNTPLEVLKRLLSMGFTGNEERGFPFTFASRLWGNFVISEIDFTFVQLVDTGQPEIIDIDLRLLQIN